MRVALVRCGQSDDRHGKYELDEQHGQDQPAGKRSPLHPALSGSATRR